MMEQFGTAWLIVFAHVCTSLRCLAYTLLPPDALSTNICVLLLQTLHGNIPLYDPFVACV